MAEKKQAGKFKWKKGDVQVLSPKEFDALVKAGKVTKPMGAPTKKLKK